jgi:hypothetical protein
MNLSRRLIFIDDSIDLNFEINNHDWIPATENVILMDFMECINVADIFIITLE